MHDSLTPFQEEVGKWERHVGELQRKLEMHVEEIGRQQRTIDELENKIKEYKSQIESLEVGGIIFSFWLQHT